MSGSGPPARERGREGQRKERGREGQRKERGREGQRERGREGERKQGQRDRGGREGERERGREGQRERGTEEGGTEGQRDRGSREGRGEARWTSLIIEFEDSSRMSPTLIRSSEIQRFKSSNTIEIWDGTMFVFRLALLHTSNQSSYHNEPVQLVDGLQLGVAVEE